MPAAKNPPKGRPKIVWTKEQLETFKSLLQIQCTENEVCAVMKIDADTMLRIINEQLYKDITGKQRTKKSEKLLFSDALKRYGAEGRASLRRAQYHKAVEENNTTMQIWLGKQLLGQTDQVVETVQAVPTFYFDPGEIN